MLHIVENSRKLRTGKSTLLNKVRGSVMLERCFFLDWQWLLLHYLIWLLQRDSKSSVISFKFYCLKWQQRALIQLTGNLPLILVTLRLQYRCSAQFQFKSEQFLPMVNKHGWHCPTDLTKRGNWSQLCSRVTLGTFLVPGWLC